MEKKSTTVYLRLLCVALCILLTGILFSASRKSNVSNSASEAVTKFVTDKMTSVTGVNYNQYRSHIVVRKSGHFVEYSMLGILVASGVSILRHRQGTMWVTWGWGLFACLFIADVDEFVQSYFKRSSSVSDVLFDFGSSLAGIGMFRLALWWRCRRHRHKQLNHLAEKDSADS